MLIVSYVKYPYPGLELSWTSSQCEFKTGQLPFDRFHLWGRVQVRVPKSTTSRLQELLVHQMFLSIRIRSTKIFRPKPGPSLIGSGPEKFSIRPTVKQANDSSLFIMKFKKRQIHISLSFFFYKFD